MCMDSQSIRQMMESQPGGLGVSTDPKEKGLEVRGLRSQWASTQGVAEMNSRVRSGAVSTRHQGWGSQEPPPHLHLPMGGYLVSLWCKKALVADSLKKENSVFCHDRSQ